MSTQVAAWRLDREGSRVTELLLALLAASVLAFSQLADAVANEGPIVSFDSTAAAWLHAHEFGVATTVLGAVTKLGGAQVLLVVTLVAALVLLLARRPAYAALMGAALAGGEGLNWALKAAFERPRPWFADPLASAGGFSFPSGHAMVSLTVYGALAFVVAASVGSRRARLRVFASAAALVLAIGFSRVYLGVHYVSDVLAAYSAGLAWLMLCALALRAGSARAARRSTGSAVRREEVDPVAVGIVDHGVALAPDRVPGLLVPLVSERDELVVGGIDVGRGLAAEGQADALPSAGWLPLGVEGADRLDRVPAEAQPAGEGHLHVRLPVGLGR
jgi:membrane-associated phospholipid phosphatase